MKMSKAAMSDTLRVVFQASGTTRAPEVDQADLAMKLLDEHGFRVRQCWVTERGFDIETDTTDGRRHTFPFVTNAGDARRAARRAAPADPTADGG